MATVPEAQEQDPIRRYSNGAVVIHWVTAALILVQIWLGFQFADMTRGPGRDQLFTWHKTVGATILLLAFVRLGYRLANPPPPFPPELPRWERIAATWNHRLFYLLLFVLPLTGLLAVSGHAKGATTPLIGGIPFPVIPGVSAEFSEKIGDVHGTLVLVTIALLVLHVGAALKQQFYDRPGRTAGRMPPFQPRTEEVPVPNP
ncbi:cytochrome b [Sphingomonas ginkgonis]|uniref:Cytochrome b n=1 Tax=Sphingomonas ginkgonis TaxID=2315330 RepID=A0A429VD44_9SPHN|nr:cytochrome b [Sphingomonas ginkgonis]RST31930.1 cytochrome b [Sphingomonas ginkgonis]